MKFDLKARGIKSTRNRTLIKLLKSPSLMISASSVSKTLFFSSDLDELCHKLGLWLQEKKAGKNSKRINDEIVAIVNNLLEYNCMSKKHHKQFSIKCNLVHK